MVKSKFQDKVCYVYSKGTTTVPVGLNYNNSNFKSGHYLIVHDTRKTSVSASHNLTLVDNSPIKNIELINQRTVLINNKYFYFVDNDFIADLAFNSLVDKNKKINGEFIFYKKAGKYKLLRVGGEEYNKIVDTVRRSNLKKISRKEFVPGTVYLTPGNKMYLFLGNVDTISIPWTSYSNSGDRDGVTKKSVKNKPLFYRMFNRDNESFSISKDNISNLIYRLEIKESHSLVESYKNINIDSNVVDKIRDLSIKDFKSELTSISQNQSRQNYLWIYRKYCSWINLHLVGDKNFKEFDADKYMLFA